MNFRRAVSLIELLLTMSACSVILTMSAALLHRVMHAQSKSSAILDAERAALRLSDYFRRDVRTATNATTEPARLAPDALVRLERSTGSAVEYRRTANSLLRVELSGANVVAREQFVFPHEYDAEVAPSGADLLTLTITAPRRRQRPTEAQVAPVSVQVTARLRPLRLAPLQREKAP